MKIYFVSDENEITHCALFRNKKDAQRYIKEQETDEESSLELNVIEFEPNKNGIMSAMRSVLSHSNNDIQDWD
jgi:hypothetical protein